MAAMAGAAGLAQLTMLPPGLCDWDDWERRAQHREACIAAVKRSSDYVAAAQHFPRASTPDPRQAEVSKRAWEKGVRQWRMDLKALAVAGGGLAPGAAGVGEPHPRPRPLQGAHVHRPGLCAAGRRGLRPCGR